MPRSFFPTRVLLSGIIALTIGAFGFPSKAATLTVLHAFGAVDPNTGASPDGQNPAAPLCPAADGNLYGVAPGGPNNNGVIFMVTPAGVFTTLYTFPDAGTTGAALSGLAQGLDANFYGMTTLGIFKMTTAGTADSTTVTMLYTSSGLTGSYFFGSTAKLTPGGLGVFYGTAEGGGKDNKGVVFQMMTDGTPAGTAVTTLHDFGELDDQFNNDGADPTTTMILGSDGNLYGTTSPVGPYNSTVFRITTGGDLRTLYVFPQGEDGGSGASSLVEGTPGVYYGADESGGTDGFGTIFDVTSAGAYTRLYSFVGENINSQDYDTNLAGLNPGPELVLLNGVFYGFGTIGGTNGTGTIFSATSSGQAALAYTFPGSSANNEGTAPTSLVAAPDGMLYGTAGYGGANGTGTIFQFNPNSGPPPLPPIASFSANGPATAGAPITFSVTTGPGLTARIQATTTPGDEGSWTDLADGNSGHMTESPPNSSFYTLTTTSYPLASGVYFRAVVSKSGYADQISSPLGPYSLQANITFSATGPFGPGGPISFSATMVSGWSVRVQSSLTPEIEGSWTDLGGPNYGYMNEGPVGQYTLTSSDYPNASGVAFRAIASKSGYADLISTPLTGYNLSQAVLSISLKLTTSSDPANGAVAHIGDNLVYTYTIINSGSITASNLQVVAPLTTYLPSDNSGIPQTFTGNDVTSISSGGQIRAWTSGLAVVWSMGDLDANSQASVTYTIHLSSNVRADQQLGSGTDYNVASATGLSATGASSGAPAVSTDVRGPIVLTATAKTPSVAPGGLLTYSFTLSNLSATAVAHPVAVIDAPDSTRFAASYLVGNRNTTAVALVHHTGAISAAQEFYENGDKSQVVILLPALAAHPNRNGLDAVTFTVTFQAQWADPAVVPTISTVDYLGAFVQNAKFAAFDALWRTAKKTTAAAPGQTDFTAYLTDSSQVMAETENDSGVVKVSVSGSLDNEPALNLVKTLNSSSNIVTDDDGNLINYVRPGDEITYTLWAGNTGRSEADDVFIQDVMPDSSYLVGAKLLPATPNAQHNPSPQKSAATFKFATDPDGHHLHFTGLHLNPDDFLVVQYTVRIFDNGANQPAPAPGTYLNPAVAVDSSGLPEPASIGTSSSPDTTVGFYISGPLVALSAAQFAQPKVQMLGSSAVSADAGATAATLGALYKKTPNALPLVSAKNPSNYIAGVQRYYVHYENTGQPITGATLEVPLPAHTVFYRASWVSLPASDELPGTFTRPPAKASITAPAALETGDVEFHLPPLSVFEQGNVMVEVIATSDAIQSSGSIVGGSSDATITIHDATVPNAAVRKLDATSLQTHLSTSHFGAIAMNDSQLPHSAVPLITAACVVSNYVAAGETYQETVLVANTGDVDAHAIVNFTIPQGAEYVAEDAGQSYVLPPTSDSAGGVIVANLASGDGVVFDNDTAPLKAHTAAALTVTLRATGGVGSYISGNNAVVLVDNLGKVTPMPQTTAIVAAGTQDATGTATTLANGALFELANDGQDLVLINLGNGNIVAGGGGNIVAGGGGNIIAAGGGNVVAQGPAASLAIGQSTAAALWNNKDKIVAAGGGNIVAAGGGNIVAAGGGNIVAAGGGNIVAAGGGNIVAGGGGNIVAGGGGNIVAGGGGNVVAAGNGHYVVVDGANIVAGGGGNLKASVPGSAASLRTSLGNLINAGASKLQSQ